MVRSILLGVGVFAAFLAILIFSGKIPIGDSSSKPVGDVAIWGTLPETQMNAILQQFNPQAKTYRVTYRYVSENSFNQTLLEALASGVGPDLIIAPHQIILSQEARLASFPITSLPEKTYKDLYVDGATIFFRSSGAIALPISIDPLVLFYNRTLFSRRGLVSPPSTWDEVLSMTPTLTIRNASGGFDQSAINLGAPNTSYAKDILMAIVSQLGQSPVTPVTKPDGTTYYYASANTPATSDSQIFPLSTATRYFVQFADPSKTSYTWTQFLGSADSLFVAEKLAMYIGHASELSSLQERNPRANFDMTFLPQTKGYNTFVTGAEMYGIATLKATKNPTTALTVESQFAGSGIAPALAQVVGAVPALRSYAGTAGISPIISRSLLVATTWYDKMPTDTTNLTTSMISDVLNGRVGPNDAANQFSARLQDLYNPITNSN